MSSQFTPWSGMSNSDQAPTQPMPSASGTTRDYATMLNERGIKQKRPHIMKMNETHWELPKKLKLGSI